MCLMLCEGLISDLSNLELRQEVKAVERQEEAAMLMRKWQGDRSTG